MGSANKSWGTFGHRNYHHCFQGFFNELSLLSTPSLPNPRSKEALTVQIVEMRLRHTASGVLLLDMVDNSALPMRPAFSSVLRASGAHASPLHAHPSRFGIVRVSRRLTGLPAPYPQPVLISSGGGRSARSSRTVQRRCVNAAFAAGTAAGGVLLSRWYVSFLLCYQVLELFFHGSSVCRSCSMARATTCVTSCSTARSLAV